MSTVTASKDDILQLDRSEIGRLARRFANLAYSPADQRVIAEREMFREGLALKERKLNVLAYACFAAAAGEVSHRDYQAAFMQKFGKDEGFGAELTREKVAGLMIHISRGWAVDVNVNDIRQFMFLEEVRKQAAMAGGSSDPQGVKVNTMFKRILGAFTLA